MILNVKFFRLSNRVYEGFPNADEILKGWNSWSRKWKNVHQKGRFGLCEQCASTRQPLKCLAKAHDIPASHIRMG